VTIVRQTSPSESVTSSEAEPFSGPTRDPLSRWFLAVLAVFFLILTFVQSPGLIIDDTKLPVIMAPLAWIRSSLHLWNPSVSSGSVQSGTFGYLFPMAPFFELMHVLHVPVWCAERLWLALLLTIGAWGVIRLAEALRIGNQWARMLGAIAYCVAPLVVDWAAVSAALLAVVFLPWVLRPLVVGSETGSPRRAAAKSGVAIALMGGVNATVILSALPLAVIWLLTRDPGPRRRSLLGWWAVCVVLACFWWSVATVLQGKYGYNYLPYTETATVTTSTGSVFDALRGTSFWQNFDDVGGPLIPGGWTLVTSWVAIVATTLVTALGLAGLARRIPERLFLVITLSFGVFVIAVGYDGALGSPFSSNVIDLLSGALGPIRNISKFSPLITLPLALGLASLVSTVSLGGQKGRWPNRLLRKHWRPLIGSLAVIAVVFAAIPFWQLQLYPSGGFAAIPSYWTQAANWLDGHQGHQTALLVPGANFAEYTWGSPQDEPLSVLASTSVTARSIIPLGSDGNTVMLSAVEDALAAGTSQPGLAEYLSRSGIDYVVERNDLNLEATGAIPPAQVHQVLSESSGLVQVAAFGPYLPRSQVAQGALPVYDSKSYAHLRSVEIYKIEPAVSEVQSYPASNPLVVSGSSGSLLPLAETGVLNGRAAVLANDAHAAGAASSAGANWVITDGNQRRAVAFGKVEDNLSYLLAASQLLYRSPALTYGTLGAGDAQTVAAPIGAAEVLASSYGSGALHLEPSEGPSSAFDENPATAWVASSNRDSTNQWLSIRFDRAVPLTSIAITPLIGSPQRPTIKWVTITTDRGSVRRYIPARNSPAKVSVAPGSTLHLKITIDATRHESKPANPPQGAGITDVAIPGIAFQPAMQLPTDELATFSGAASAQPILSITDPITSPNLDFTGPIATVEPAARKFVLPKALSATIIGTAVPTPSTRLEGLLETLTGPAHQEVQISASSWLRALPKFRPDNLLEKSSTPWIAGLGDRSPSLTLRWDGNRAVSSISLGLSREASSPTEVTITSPAGTRKAAVPEEGGIVSFAPMTTDTLTIRFTALSTRLSAVPTGPHTVGLPPASKIPLPVGLSSLGVPALGSQAAPSPSLSTKVALPCGTGPVVQVDNAPVSTQVAGTLGNLVNLQPMDIRTCTPRTTTLAAGHHVISFPPGSAFRVTSLLVRQPQASSTQKSQTRSVHVMSWAPGKRTLSIGAGTATYIQVAQNFNAGWVATLNGRTLKPVSLSGWEQGWILPAGASGVMTMNFEPDQTYRAGLLIGGLLLLTLFILALARGNRFRGGPIGPRKKLPAIALAGAAAIGVLCIGGASVLLLVPLVAIAYRWGSSVAAAIAGVSFTVAGVIVAIHPDAVDAIAGRSISAFVEICAMTAFCAVISSVIVEEGQTLPHHPVRPENPGPVDAPTANA
jgi:arabinofuranan 3-O-arabinosyltransferase